jgi:hypothetical protein
MAGGTFSGAFGGDECFELSVAIAAFVFEKGHGPILSPKGSTAFVPRVVEIRHFNDELPIDAHGAQADVPEMLHAAGSC